MIKYMFKLFYHLFRFSNKKNNLVITIMAGGNGTRMNSTTPKVLHNFFNKPFIIRLISEMVKLNPKKIIIITGKHHDKIIEKCKELIPELLNKYKIIFVRQSIPDGTGGAIKCCLTEYNKYDRILILNGDSPALHYDFIEPILKSINEDFKNTILTVNMENPSGYGRIVHKKESNDIINDIIEEKECNNEQKKINIVNTGIYYLLGDTILENIKHIKKKNNEYYLTALPNFCDFFHQIHEYRIPTVCNLYTRGVNTQSELKTLEYNIQYTNNIYLFN